MTSKEDMKDRIPEEQEEEVVEEQAEEQTAEEQVDEQVDEQTADEQTAEEQNADDAEFSPESGDADGDEDVMTKYLRLMAEFQNYKKRTAKEKEDIYKFGAEKLAKSIVDVMDNFERALEQGSTDAKFQQGMELILTQMTEALAKQGVNEIPALGEDFDPNYHSAVLMEDSDEYESGKVCFVVQKGYELNGKVIRPSVVKVAN